jgi:hypothetical protein
MKYLILTVLLAIMQKSPPVPRKAADSPATTSQKFQRKASTNQTPTAPPQPMINTNAAPNHDTARNEQGTDNAQNPISVSKLPPVSITKDWLDWGGWIFSLFLVVVGALQVVVLIRQAGLMGKHAEHLKNLATAANDNALAAKDGAEAANKNIEMFISKERARIVVTLQKLTLVPKSGAAYTVDYVVSSHGPTPAFITDTRCVAYILPITSIASPDAGEAFNFPVYSLPKVISPNSTPQETFAFLYVDESNLSQIKAGRLFVGMRGFIKYKDVFDRDRQTGFRYVWKYLPHGLYGLSGDYGDWEECGTEADNHKT